MPETFKPSQVDKEFISLLLDDPTKKRPPLRLEKFTEYSFSSNFLQPTDGWHFSFGTEFLDAETAGMIVPGTLVELFVNGALQSTGYIDSLTVSTSRGGKEYRIEGRDKLARAVDACADPLFSAKDGETLADFLPRLFKNYGWPDEENFSIDAAADRDIRSNEFRSKSKKSEGKGFGRRALKQYKLHQKRANARESIWEFASRITQRFGLWIWASADGRTLFVSTPDFEQEPRYKLLVNREDTTNVLSSSVKRSAMNQPSAIIADGYSYGGEFGKSKNVVIMFNKAVSLGDLGQDPEVLKYEKAGAKFIEGPVFPFPNLMTLNSFKPVYLHDDESQTLEQLEAFVRREMSLLQRQSLEVAYVVEGHGQIVDGTFKPWTVDTIVSVDDQPAGLKEDLYVIGRTFNKSRGGGTTTNLELIRKNTISFTDTSSKKR